MLLGVPPRTYSVIAALYGRVIRSVPAAVATEWAEQSGAGADDGTAVGHRRRLRQDGFELQ